jgi:FkbM family methyltransferase
MKNFYLRHRLISFLNDFDIKGIRKLSHFLPQILIPSAKGSLKMKTIYGFYLIIDPVKDNGVERSIYFTGTYEKGTLYIIKNILNKGDTFIDVGANIGLMSVFASKVIGGSGKVIAFEPNPNTLALLKNNIELNKCTNITTSDYAIGNANETAKIYDRWDSNRGSATLIKPEKSTDSYDIKISTLSDVLSDSQKIDLIKLDIEGYELEALKGAENILKRDIPPALIVECSDISDNDLSKNRNEVYDYIKKLDKYRIYRTISDKGRISKLIEMQSKVDLLSNDNIYCFTEKHLDKMPSSIFK